MKYNYYIAQKEFERMWEKTEKACLEAGMSPEAITELKEFDWTLFKSDRIYALHTSDVPMSEEDEFFDVPSILSLCPQAMVATNYDIFGGHSRYWWLEEIENPCLAIGIGALTEDDKELLTLYILEQKTECEIARALGVHHTTISRRLQKIFSRFKRDT